MTAVCNVIKHLTFYLCIVIIRANKTRFTLFFLSPLGQRRELYFKIVLLCPGAYE